MRAKRLSTGSVCQFCRHIDGRWGSESRMFSTSSGSSDASGGGTDNVVQSDEEEVHADTLLLTSVPRMKDEETGEEAELIHSILETQVNQLF